MNSRLKHLYFTLKNLPWDLKNQLMGSKDYRKFVIITRSRTGSSLYTSLLNSHPAIIAYEERFDNLHGKSCREVWQEVFNKKPKEVEQVGFKLFYYHPQDSEDREVWELIDQDEDIKIIHLRRKNYLKSLVSVKIASQTRQYFQTRKTRDIPLEEKRVSLSFEGCMRFFNQNKEWEREIAERYSDREIFDLTYEELVRNKQGIANRSFAFLGLSPCEVQSEYRKQNKESMEDLVTNYDEITEKLKDTEWDYLLNLQG